MGGVAASSFKSFRKAVIILMGFSLQYGKAKHDFAHVTPKLIGL